MLCALPALTCSVSNARTADVKPQAPRHAAARARQRAAVTATFVSHGLLFASWTAHIPQLKLTLGLSDSTLGLVLLATPVGAVCSMLIARRLLPMLGSRALIRICVLGYCAAGPLVGLASSPLLLAVALFTWGAFQGSLDVAMNTQAVAVERSQRRHLMPSFHGAWSVGSFAGAGVGAIAVAVHVSLASQLLVLALPVLAAAAAFNHSLIARQDERNNHEAPRAATGGRPPLPRATVVLGATVFASMLCEGATADWSAVYLRGPVHADPATAGLGYAVFALVMAAVRLSGGPLLVRLPTNRLLPTLAALGTAAMTIALAADTQLTALIGFAFLGAGLALVVPTVFSAAGNLPGLAPGIGIATVSAYGWAGFVCGPPLIGALAGIFGLRAALAVIPTLTLIVTLVTARGGAIHPRIRAATRR
jgi:MFS family permease